MDERELLVRIIGDDRELQRALGNTDRRLKQIDNRTATFGKNIKTAFAAAGIGIGISTFAAVLRDTAQASIDFEEAFAGVRKTVDASEAEFDALSSGLRDLAKEIPITVIELTRIAEAAGQLGVAKENILDFTRTVADLAATTDLSSEAAADSLARLTNITGLPQAEVDKLGSAVVDLGNKMAATESEIIDFALRIAGAGRQAELTDAQIVGIAGAFRSVGVESEAGGTAVQKVLLSMTSAARSGGKQLQLFAQVTGQSVENFQKSFGADSGKAFVDFVQGLEEVREQGGNVFKVLERLGFTDQRLVRAFLSMSSNSQLLADSLEIGTAAFRDNIALTEEAEKRYATTASQIQIFENNVNDLKISLGDQLVVALEDATRVANLLFIALDKFRGVDFSPGFDFPDPPSWLSGAALAPISPLAAGLAVGSELLKDDKQVTDITQQLNEQVQGSIRELRQALEKRQDALEKLDVKDQERARRSFDTFVKGMGLKLDKASLDDDLTNDLAVLRELERAIVRRIAVEGKTFKLVQLLTNTRLSIKAIVDRQADDARQAGEDAFRSVIDSLELNLERAQATSGLADDQAALRALERRLLARIEAEGETTELLRQLFQNREEQKRVAEQIREQARERRQGQQFEALGLTVEGEERVAGISAIRKRGRGLIEELEASGLDEKKVATFVKRISAVFTKQFDDAGRNVRQSILDLFATISDALDEGSKGPLTKTSGLNTKKILAGLGLSDEEINALRGRLSSINSAGNQLAGIQTGSKPSPLAGFGGVQGPILVESHTTINLDGQQVANVVTRQQQKTKRRNPQQKRGPNRNR